MTPLVILSIGISVVLFCIIVLRLHAVLSLLMAAAITGLLTPTDFIYEFAISKGATVQDAVSAANLPLGKRLAAAFGNTAGKIGILIAMASIIGACLMRSGGAERIVRSLLKVFGKKNPSIAFLTSSFTLAIPIFFDTVFYLMIPLVKSVGVKMPRQFGLSLMAVTAGSAMAHSLIPPTPGPLFAAEELGVDIGAMIIGGLTVGIFTILSGYLYSIWANQKWDLPMRDTPDINLQELRSLAEKEDVELPGLGRSLLPIVLPLVLIAGNTTINTFWRVSEKEMYKGWLTVINTLGDSNIALIISALFAMGLLWSRERNYDRFSTIISKSLISGGIIILITASGGAFGNMLQQTGIGNQIGAAASNYQIAVLPLAFVITAVMRIAQGSATVAMITAIGILSGIADSATLGFHPVYLALVIGCGSKVFPWMNDSGFWIITQMSGMEKQETFRHFSILLAVMGFAGMILIVILAQLFPFV